MAQPGTLKNAAVAGSPRKYTGRAYLSLAGWKPGQNHDVILDHSSADIRYVVVDAGGWLSTKKFLVPAEAIRISAKHENHFDVTSRSARLKDSRPTMNPIWSPNRNGQGGGQPQCRGIGSRWDSFQSRLRERRKDPVASCGTCAGESAVKRGLESDENLRLAV